jgi:hypothetical protein
MIWQIIGIISVIVIGLAWAHAERRARRAEARVRQLTAPKPSPAQAKMMGLESPGDQKVPITVRDWDALKRAIWRSKIALEIAERQASVILEQCSHVPLCPGKTSDIEPCFKGCVDREKRLSACVILAAARQLTAAVNARKPPDGPYYAPTREYFSETLSALAAAQVEIEILRAALRREGVDPLDIALTLNPPSTPAQLEEPK